MQIHRDCEREVLFSGPALLENSGIDQKRHRLRLGGVVRVVVGSNGGVTVPAGTTSPRG